MTLVTNELVIWALRTNLEESTFLLNILSLRIIPCDSYVLITNLQLVKDLMIIMYTKQTLIDRNLRLKGLNDESNIKFPKYIYNDFFVG